MARVLVINTLLVRSLLYSMALWSKSNEELHAIENLMYDSLWVGQKDATNHMVNLSPDLFTVIKPKWKGVGLIPFKTKVLNLETNPIGYLLSLHVHTRFS